MRKILEKLTDFVKFTLVFVQYAVVGHVDKLMHFVACLLLTLWLAPLLGIAGAVFVAWCIGLAKEIYDEARPESSFSWGDLLADVLGIVAAAVPLYLMGG